MSHSNKVTRYRIFVASPGDVGEEREAVRRVVDRIEHEAAFEDRLSLKVIAWDQPGAESAMGAHLTPQAAIAKNLPKFGQDSDVSAG